MTTPAGNQSLRRWEWVGLALLGLLIVAFGVLTEIRSCFLTVRHTDFGMLARTGWAVRTGIDIYTVTDNLGLHYTYPSAFSLLMTPFADPAAGHDRTGYLPFSVSVAIWYLISFGLIVWAIDAMAKCVLPDAIRGSRRWWYARTGPLIACLGGIGFTLGKGQVTLFLVALAVAGFVAAMRGRRVASGIWIGAAAVTKAIPAFLVLFVVARRDWRGAAGVAIAAFAGLVVIPLAVWGPERTIAQHKFFVQNVLLAGTTGKGGEERFGQELTETNATDSQSFQSSLHHIRYINTPREDRPAHASSDIRLAHWGISGALTLITLLVAHRRLTPRPEDQLLLLGCLFALMMVVTPVSHMHYYAFLTPMASALWLKSQVNRPGAVLADRWTIAALAIWAAATSIPLFTGPPFSTLREVGSGTFATVGLWAFGLAKLGRNPAAVAAAEPAPLRLAA